jgi:hypothetical protein
MLPIKSIYQIVAFRGMEESEERYALMIGYWKTCNYFGYNTYGMTDLNVKIINFFQKIKNHKSNSKHIIGIQEYEYIRHLLDHYLMVMNCRV